MLLGYVPVGERAVLPGGEVGMGPRSFGRVALMASVLGASLAAPAWAASHLWIVNEVYSNADGSIQFIELFNPGDAGETFIDNHTVKSFTTGHLYTICPAVAEECNLPEDSALNKYLLFATPGFAFLPGAPTPDYTFPAGNFFSLDHDTIQWHVYTTSQLIFTPGQLPLDGVHSLRKNGASLVVDVASPTNFAGSSWSAPPAVPDGSGGALPFKIGKLNAAGSQLALSFEDEGCLGAEGFHLVYGTTSQLPTSLGGTYDLSGAQCGIPGSPYNWTLGVPHPVSGRFDWFLILAHNGTKEGSWGHDSAGGERDGPAPGGMSGLCSVTSKSVVNSCGN